MSFAKVAQNSPKPRNLEKSRNEITKKKLFCKDNSKDNTKDKTKDNIKLENSLINNNQIQKKKTLPLPPQQRQKGTLSQFNLVLFIFGKLLSQENNSETKII